MRVAMIGAALLGLGGAAFIGSYAFQGGGETRTAAVASFDYERASPSSRDRWLRAEADATARRFHGTLPKGANGGPAMKVAGWAVDAPARRMDILVAVSGPYGIDAGALPAAGRAMVEKVCPGYLRSPLGRNRITIGHRFVGVDGREALSVAISPAICGAS